MAVFDNVAKDYDQWYLTPMGAFVDEVETALAFSMFKPLRCMRILDVGCGTGNFSIKLAELGCSVVGIDISEEMLTLARKKAEEKGLSIEFINMDVYSLELEDKSFDGVFTMAAFEFITEPQRAFNELYRVLKPGGSLLIGTINKNSSWGRLYLSPEVQENSVFKFASFKVMEDLVELDKDSLVTTGECLFVPPTAEEDDYNLDNEAELSKSEGGGYICALWKKATL